MSRLALLCTVVISTFGVYASTAMNSTAMLACLHKINMTSSNETTNTENIVFICYTVYKSPLLVGNQVPYMVKFKGCFAMKAYLHCLPQQCGKKYLPKTFNKTITCCSSEMTKDCNKNLFYKENIIQENLMHTKLTAPTSFMKSTEGKDKQPVTSYTVWTSQTTTQATEKKMYISDPPAPMISDRFCFYLPVIGILIVVVIAVRDLLRWKLNKYCIYNVSVRPTSKQDVECTVCQSEGTRTKEEENLYEETDI